jgi:hypothetical protein
MLSEGARPSRNPYRDGGGGLAKEVSIGISKQHLRELPQITVMLEIVPGVPRLGAFALVRDDSHLRLSVAHAAYLVKRLPFPEQEHS